VTTTLAQQILEVLYHNTGVRQPVKDALADWILDTQPRARPLDPTALVGYLARQHPEFLARLARNVRLQGDVARLLVAMDPRQRSGAGVRD
jgi:hypothetical protein